MQVYIYTLEHPITQEVRYVGKTKNPKMRFQNHLNKSHNKHSHKTNWIESLKKEGLKPVMKIIEEVDENNWQFWEKFWIHQFKVWGFNLINHTVGGDGLTLGNNTSFKKGHKTWNSGLAHTEICEECGKIFKLSPYWISIKTHKFCSRECHTKYQIKNPDKNIFKKGHIVWNKNLKGIKLKKDKNVFQYCAYTGIFIKKWNTAKEVYLSLNINPISIGQCCRGKNKSSGGFLWRYFETNKIKIIKNYKLKIK